MKAEKDSASARFWTLFGLLFALIALEGSVGMVVLRRFQSSGENLRRIQDAGLAVDAVGLALNNFVKETKVLMGLVQEAGAVAPLPPTIPLEQATEELRASGAVHAVTEIPDLLDGINQLVREASVYQRQLDRQALTEATVQYVTKIEPLADRLFEHQFPASRRALLGEVDRVSEENHYSGVIAFRVLVGSLVVSLAVGLFLARLIADTLRRARDQEKEIERHQSELAIARVIQTSVVPHELYLPGFDIGAVMVPASEVGGDYYDFRATPDGGAWLAIGDVTGHGLTSGLVMMMVQSMFAVLTDPKHPPKDAIEILGRTNRALYANLKERLGEERFMTLLAMRLHRDGRLEIAGAHTDVMIYRKTSGEVERFATDGIWMGLVDEVEHGTSIREVRLERGDIALFHTDGVTEAKNGEGKMYDLGGLESKAKELASEPATEMVSKIAAAVMAWSPILADDVSLLAIRRN